MRLGAKGMEENLRYEPKPVNFGGKLGDEGVLDQSG